MIANIEGSTIIEFSLRSIEPKHDSIMIDTESPYLHLLILFMITLFSDRSLPYPVDQA